MRTILQHADTVFDDVNRQLQGLSDLEIVTVGSRTYLIAAGAADAGLSVYEILSDGSLTPVDDVLFSSGSGTNGVSDLTSFTIDGTTYLMVAGNFDNNQVVYEVGSDGSLTVSDSYADALENYQEWMLTEFVDTGSETFLFGVQWGESGFFGYDVSATGDLSGRSDTPDGPGMFLGDVSAMHSVTLHGKTFLFVASGVDVGIHSYIVGPGGVLDLRFTVPPSVGGLAGISDITSLDTGARSFIFVASAGTDSIMVYRVSQGGRLQHVETLTDTGDTRFEDVSALDAFEFNGRHFLLAAGSDGGFTLMEVDYRGRLKVLESIEDTAALALDNVTDIEIAIIDGEVHVFVSSGSEHGFSEFVLEFPNGMNEIRGGSGKDTINGTAQDDTIYGHGRNDVLYGHDGDDRLVDGRGTDILYGGAGADIFEFVPDHRTDRIMDYEIGLDKIDLSGYDLVYNVEDLEIISTSDGAIIWINGDKLRIFSDDGSSLTAGDFTMDDFIFG